MNVRSPSSDVPSLGPPAEELVAALCRPEAYPEPPGEVHWKQTHMSWLFFTRDLVYKVKKPVHFDFVDTRELETRRRLCELELRLNRRLAGDIYLGVVPITRSEDGQLRFGGPGEALEHAVCMRRLPDAGMLDVQLEQGRIDNELLREVARRLVGFHACADTGPGVDEWGWVDAVRQLVLGNIEQLAPFVGPVEGGQPSVLTPRMHAFLLHRARQFLDVARPLLESRVLQGHIRDGHGDLHAGNVCRINGEVVFYDCLEFSDRLRCCDVAADLAFLAMDLDERGFRAFSRFLVRTYARLAVDPDLLALMEFYKTHRALVRALVHALAAAEAGRSAADAAHQRARARDYVHLALSYGLPPTLLVLCGLPGTGKSWLGQRLARRLGALMVRSDVERKRLAGLAPTSHAVAEQTPVLYGSGMTEATYRELDLRAGLALCRGRSVVVDATFSSRRSRERILDEGLRLGAPTVFVHLTCDASTVRERMSRRAHDRGEVSDADWGVYERAVQDFELPDELPGVNRVDVTSGADLSVEACTARVLEHVLVQMEEQPRFPSPAEV